MGQGLTSNPQISRTVAPTWRLNPPAHRMATQNGGSYRGRRGIPFNT